MTPARLTATAVVVALVALVAAGCGKRGAPLPPWRKNPQPAEALAARQRAATIELSFTAPRLTLDGQRLPVLDVEVLYGLQHGVPLEEIAEIRELKAAPGEALTEVWPLPEPGTPVRFAVRSFADGKESPLSAELVLDVVAPPPAPSDLVASVQADGVQLFWSECVATSADPWIELLLASPELSRALAELAAFVRGEPFPDELSDEGPELDESAPGGPATGAPRPDAAALDERAPAEPVAAAASAADLPPWERPPGPLGATVPADAAAAGAPGQPPAAAPTPLPRPTPPSPGVALYRRVGTGDYEALSVAPLPAGEYLDSAVSPGESYCYQARSVLSGAALVEGGDSAEVCIEFRDVGVPDPPFGLTLLRMDDGTVELTWSAAASPDVEQYQVYRRVGPGPAELAAAVPAAERRWTDLEPASGQLSSYSVTALDAAGNESPATPEARVDLR